MKPEKHPLANALYRGYQNGDEKTKAQFIKLIELMRKVSK